jgi:signal peptidase I
MMVIKMRRENYKPTSEVKLMCLLLVILIMAMYLMDSTPISSWMSSITYSYIFKPALWGAIAFIVYCLPRLRINAKFKVRGNLIWWALNFAVIFIGASVIGGFIDGFGKSPYSHSIKGIILNMLFVGSALIARELIRSYIVNSLTKSENYVIFIVISLFMAVTNISINSFLSLKGTQGIIIFAAKTFAPEFSKNLLATYLVFLGGWVPAAVYLGIIEAANWLSPILPNLKWITTGVIGVLCPMFSFMWLQNMDVLGAIKKGFKAREKEDIFGWIATVAISIGVIWFALGVFPIYPSVVATGSMEPMIKPGDVILVKKNIDKVALKEGDIIQFRSENILISHRIIENVEENGEKGYRTKGDNNSVQDGELVMPEQVKGVVVKVVPKVGWPTLLLKSSKDVPLEKVQF